MLPWDEKRQSEKGVELGFPNVTIQEANTSQLC
jgi:hypothetical protein